MSDDLVEALRFRRVVLDALPIDDEADAMVGRLVARNQPPSAYRILRKRSRL